MRVADLPGYGRGVAEDEKYKALYINTLKDCDVILLIMQANDKAIVDDQYMVECLYEWSNEGLLVNDGTYYGQDTGLAEDFSVKEEPQSRPKEETPADYIKKIEEICEDAMRVLEKDSEEYNKIKAIFKML